MFEKTLENTETQPFTLRRTLVAVVGASMLFATACSAEKDQPAVTEGEIVQKEYDPPVLGTRTVTKPAGQTCTTKTVKGKQEQSCKNVTVKVSEVYTKEHEEYEFELKYCKKTPDDCITGEVNVAPDVFAQYVVGQYYPKDKATVQNMPAVVLVP